MTTVALNAKFNDEPFDVIVVGAGAGGCAAAHRLVTGGRRVLVVEKGGVLPRTPATLDVGAVIREGRFKSRETWVSGAGDRVVPEEYFNVGGKTKWYGAALARFAPHEFSADTLHHCATWPFRHAVLAAAYAEAEALLGVREVPCERDLARILARLCGSGEWRSAPLPMGLDPDILSHAEEAARFDGFASPRGLKADAERRLLDPIAGAPNLKVIAERPVTRLLGADDQPQRIIGVQLADGSRYRGAEVLLAAGALHSPRLLQRYLEDAGLTQLAAARNAGRYLKLHLLTAVLGVSPRLQTDVLRKTRLILADAFPHSSAQPLGFDAELLATLIPGYVPRPVARLVGRHSYGFFLQTEDGSYADNRVVEARTTDNASALPRMDYDSHRDDAAEREHGAFVRSFRRGLLRAGLISFAERIPITGTAHACGTLTAGMDPASSVVDPEGRVHGLHGLRVVDGSVLPRISRVNPSLTIFAWSLRVAGLMLATRTVPAVAAGG